MKTCIIFLLTIELAVGAFAQSPLQGTGTVVDEQGRAVAGATVDCYQYQSSRGWFNNMPRDPQINQHTITDSKGGFTFSSPPGTTLVVVKKAGLAPAWKAWNSSLAASSDPLVLTAPTILAGVVLDENEQPVTGAEVWVSDAIVGDVSSESQFNNLSDQAARDFFSARTGVDGRFRIANFPANGQADLSVSKPGKAQLPVSNISNGNRDFKSGQTNIELLLGPAGAVDGKVMVQETGQPLAGVRVWLSSTTGNSRSPEPIQSGVDGTFHIPDLLPSSYNVMSAVSGRPTPEWVVVPGTNSRPVKVTAGETASNVVIQVSKGALVEVTVVVTNELTPIANAVVSAGQSTAYTGLNGVALLRLPAGKNWFSARKDWWSQNHTAAIEAGQTNHVRIELTPPPTITGTVHDSSGVPAAGVRVSFHPGIYPNAPDYAEVMTDKNGRYEMILKVSREDFGWDGLISPTNFVLARSFEQNLAASKEFATIPTNLDLNLQPGITLSGSVKDVEGAPVTNATVDFRIESGRSSRQLGPPLTKVDAQGSFIIPAMPQGRTYFFFNDITAKGYGTTGGILKAADSKTNQYEFPTFVLKRADRMLAGQVLDPDGHPLAGAIIRLNGQGQRQGSSTKSDRHGHFVFDAVCAGELQLSGTAYTGGPPGEGIFLNSSGGSGIKAQAGDTNVVINLLDSNASSHRTPLLRAAHSGDKDAVASLLAKNADVNARDNEGLTPLLDAVKAGNLDVVEMLLTNKADVSARDRYGVTALHATAVGSSKDVAESLRVELAEVLLANKADVNVRADNGFTPLHWAALYGHADLAEVLLAHGADVNAMNNNGQTPLHWAVYDRQEDVAKVLRAHGGLEQGYAANKPAGTMTNWDIAALRGAIQGDDLKEIKTLLQANPDVIFSKDEQNRTPLILAAFQDKKDAAALLLAGKADIKATDIFGRTPLHWASQRGFKDVVELLLANHAEIEVRDKNGATPLFLAADLGRKDVVEFLIANQADVNTTNNAGSTPLHSLMAQQQKNPPAGTTTLPQATQAAVQAMQAARSQRQKEVIEVLRQHGGQE